MDSGVNMDNSDPSLEAIGPGKINRLETELYNDEEMQEVTGPPSRNGWKVRPLLFAALFLLASFFFDLRLSISCCHTRVAMPIPESAVRDPRLGH